MLISGNIKFKKAIIVNRNLLEKIEAIILEYFNGIRYYAVLENDDTIVFESLDELLEYDNYKFRKLKRLSILTDKEFELIFYEDYSLLHNYNNTVVGKYITKNNDDSILIVEKIQNALDKSKQPLHYRLFSKFSIAYMVIALGIISFIMNILKIPSYEKEYTISEYFNNVLIIVFILMIIAKVVEKVINYFFQPIIFQWGLEVERINKIKNLRSNIFWVIFVGTLLTVLLNFIL